QVRNIAKVTTAVANGDLSQKITVEARGEILELKDTINTMVDQLRSFAAEVTRVAKEVGTEGKLGGQANVPGVAGTWKDLTDNVNFMASNLTTQVRGIVKVVTAVANGDLRRKFVVEAKGEIAELAETINDMTETLGLFAEQVTTVAREVGVEGKLGGQARVPGVAGTWKDLTDNVNLMASNLTTQVRGIVKVVTAVANGDLSQKLIGVEAKGEIAALADTINNMCDTLRTFSDQVTSVAREVGIEGKLGGQAKVPGAMGTWRQLTDNVNQLAGNLTTQVRAISDVATAVTKGDLTRSIGVQAEGEVALLKDNINQMIINLRETTQKNQEQDWLKTNLAKFSSMMQGQKNLETVSELIMSQLTPLVSAHYGAFFMLEDEGGLATLGLMSSYAYRERKSVSSRFRLREGLVGQCAHEKKTILLTRVPGDYVQISSGLGEGTPLNIIVLPVLFEGQVKAVIELASFHPFSSIHQLFLDQLTESIGVVLNMITANMRTEQLLSQQRKLTQELQSQSQELTQQQDELRRTNIALEKQAGELEEKARELAEQNRQVEEKNREVEEKNREVEEKAEQLALASKYKSEFLANMSHELRTPLNSLLILAKLLSDNADGNLSSKQVEYAKTVFASGGDLLSLINEILDLSKVESGTMQVEPRDVPFDEVSEFVERGFAHMAEQKGLGFAVELGAGLPPTLRTDPQRLQQVLKNLLANAFKFTDVGRVTLRVDIARPGADFANPRLARAGRVVSFAVLDTGIGIPRDKQQIIFEAFRQADGTTSRRYGGTGLGLSISRELAKLLGGEIRVESVPGHGSTFTLFLPEIYVAENAEAGEGRARRLPEPHPPAPRREVPPFVPAPALIADSTLPGPPSGREMSLARTASTPPAAGRGRAPEGDPSAGAAEFLAEVYVEDDRENLREGDRVLLVIEDDPKFSRIMVGIAREQGFKAVVAPRGDVGFATANDLVPDAITLDIQLPIMDGWVVLDRLKRNPRTRHIPVHLISVAEGAQRGASMGALAYLEKPVSREALVGAFSHLGRFLERSIRRLLLVEAGGEGEAESSIAPLLREGDDLECVRVATCDEAVAELASREYDCMVVDATLPDRAALRLLERVKSDRGLRRVPVVVYAGAGLSPSDEASLKRQAESVVWRTSSDSIDRLLEETSLFLHRSVAELPPRVRNALRESRRRRVQPPAPTVLLVDDDVRNLYAMTSALESRGMRVLHAENGRAGLEALARMPEVSIVLMDIMMPGMDGYETMRAIRSDPKYNDVPIIAVTAKALKEDRQKCLQAGASDYLPKPVDTQKLFELINVWTGNGAADA
nr:response regulator [Polyangiaceae bacterium]